ncbi:hypothetical protein BKA69DRAFT_1078144 [Paraphysoderma sedebokerense]|nr:hypothetical protein BKA69DRAFT_1078144 [Paraphysoderma sedebokerense]
MDEAAIHGIVSNTTLGFIIGLCSITLYQSNEAKLKILSLIYLLESICFTVAGLVINPEVALFMIVVAYVLDVGAIAGFTVMNYGRLRNFIKGQYSKQKLRALDFVCGITLLFSFIANVILAVTQVHIYNLDEQSAAALGPIGRDMYVSFAMYDAIINMAISLRFATFLKTLVNPSIKSLVKRCTILILSEGVLILIASILVASNVDVNYTGLYTMFAVRYYVYSEFARSLRKVLRSSEMSDHYFTQNGEESAVSNVRMGSVGGTKSARGGASLTGSVHNDDKNAANAGNSEKKVTKSALFSVAEEEPVTSSTKEISNKPTTEVDAA